MEAKHAQEETASPDVVRLQPGYSDAPKSETKPESKEENHELEKTIETLRKLEGEATSPQLVKELGFEGESARNRVRRLMEKLHAEHRTHRTKEGRVYHFKIAETGDVEWSPRSRLWGFEALLEKLLEDLPEEKPTTLSSSVKCWA